MCLRAFEIRRLQSAQAPVGRYGDGTQGQGSAATPWQNQDALVPLSARKNEQDANLL